MTVDRAALERRWIHSHEEDTPDEMVLRPDDYPFPPVPRPDGVRAPTRQRTRARLADRVGRPGPAGRREEL